MPERYRERLKLVQFVRLRSWEAAVDLTPGARLARTELTHSENGRAREERFEAAEQLGAMGSWEWRADPEQLIWSDNLFRLFGLEPGEVEPTADLVVELAHPDDREHVRSVVEPVRTGGKARLVEFRMILQDQEVRHFRSMTTEVEARPRRMLGYVQDITERRRAEHMINAHIAVADALGRWESLDQSGYKLLRALGEGMEFVAGALWVPQGKLLVPRLFWHQGPVDTSRLEAFVRAHPIPRGLGLAGRVWVSRESASLVSPFDSPAFEQSGPATLAGMRGAVAFPALHGEHVLAVLKFYSRARLASKDRLMRSLVGIGRELGYFLDRRHGELEPVMLTPRQLEVLQLASRGNSAPQIAEELMVSRDTVKTHFRHVYLKLDVNDRAAAVAQALRMGLIE